MRLATWLLALAALVAVGSAQIRTPIKHVVVLMLENRSFDHMLGFVKSIPVNGLNGTESNPIDTTDPSKGSVTVDHNSPYIGPCDPSHGTPATTQKIFGKAGSEDVARMDGFIEYEAKNPQYCGVLSMVRHPPPSPCPWLR